MDILKYVVRILVNEANVDVEAKNIVLPAGVPSRSQGEKDSCGTKKA